MRSVWYGATMLGAVAAAGCGAGGEVTEPSARESLATTISLSRTEDRERDEAKQKVTGSALFQIDYAGNPFQHFSVAAIRHRDGSFSGEFEEKSEQDGGQHIKGTIHCFSIVADTARIAGRVTKSDIDFGPPGSYVVWNVVDGGKARGAGGSSRIENDGARDDRRGKRADDLTTDFYFGGTRAQADAHCGANLLRGQPYYEVLRGELEVDE